MVWGHFWKKSISAIFRPIWDPFRGHLELFWGQSTPFTGKKQAKQDSKAARTLPKWIPSQSTATRCMSRGHWILFGTIWGRFGPNDTVYGVERTEHEQKGLQTLLKWIPPKDTATGPHRRPSPSPRSPFGAIWGRFGAVFGASRCCLLLLDAQVHPTGLKST